MMITVAELKKELNKLPDNKFIIVTIEGKDQYIMDEIVPHVENDKWNYEIRIGKCVS